MSDSWSALDTQRAPPGSEARTFPLTGPRSFFFSPELGRFLQDSIGGFDVVHVHGLRHWPGLAARRAAVAAGKRLLISPHGALYPEHLRGHRLRKWIIHALFENDTLQSAACLHATSTRELDSLRRFGCGNPAAMIPLGIWPHPRLEAAQAGAGSGLPGWHPQGGRRGLLYLGVLRPKKGLMRLLAAWSVLERRFPDWQLLIAGPSVESYGEQLQGEVARLGLHERVTFLGPVYGADKIALLDRSELLVLPSDWENFGIVVGEALAAGVPVVASRTAPWPSLESEACGWWIEPTAVALQQVLAEALALPAAELARRGARGRQLIAREFDWQRAGAEMAGVYAWLAGRAPTPACVSTQHGNEAAA